MLSFQEIILKKRNIDMTGHYRYFPVRRRRDGWCLICSKTSLGYVAENTPFERISSYPTNDWSIERIESMRKNGVELDVRSPRRAMSIHRKDLSEWFEIVAQIEKERGIDHSRLTDRCIQEENIYDGIRD